jgi:hypothetical protein
MFTAETKKAVSGWRIYCILPSIGTPSARMRIHTRFRRQYTACVLANSGASFNQTPTWRLQFSGAPLMIYIEMAMPIENKFEYEKKIAIQDLARMCLAALPFGELTACHANVHRCATRPLSPMWPRYALTTNHTRHHNSYERIVRDMATQAAVPCDAVLLLPHRSMCQACRLMDLVRANYSMITHEVEPTEVSMGWDTEALAAPSMDSNLGPTFSAIANQDCAPRRFSQTPGLLYIHKSSLLGWHRILGNPVCRPAPQLGAPCSGVYHIAALCLVDAAWVEARCTSTKHRFLLLAAATAQIHHDARHGLQVAACCSCSLDIK